MDELDEAIASKRREVAEHTAEVRRGLEKRRRAKLELAALEYAASLRPARAARRRHAPMQHSTGAHTQHPRRRGRQPGAISQSSLDFLAAVHSVGGPASYEDIREALDRAGIEMPMSQVRDKVRRLRDDYLCGDRDEGFGLTEAGLAKIGIHENEEGPDDTGTVDGATSSSGGVVDFDDDIPF